MDHQTWIDRYLLGDLEPGEVKQLDRRLSQDPDLRREFVLATTVDASLRELAFRRGVESIEPKQQSRWPITTLLTVAFSVAASIALVIGLAWTWQWQPAVAELTSSENAAWESLLPTTAGSDLAAGVLSLKSGVATIRFRSGAEVILEAPAELQLIDAMRGRLMSGAAVIDVPESAIGFVMESPGGYAVDYGTRFAVRVDRDSKVADFELIEGEIAVHSESTGQQVRLIDQGKTATITANSLSVERERSDDGQDDTEEDAAQEDALSTDSSQVVRLRTGDRFGSAMRRNEKRSKFISRKVLSVKKSNHGKWDHRSFFSFDVASIDWSHVKAVRLNLNLVPSARGLASRLPIVNRFGVFGLTDTSKADWPQDCRWEQSPSSDDGLLLGTFEVQRSQQRGVFGIKGEKLLEFVRSCKEDRVTFVLERQTTQIEGFGPGLTHLFASDEHPESVGPVLEVVLK